MWELRYGNASGAVTIEFYASYSAGATAYAAVLAANDYVLLVEWNWDLGCYIKKLSKITG